MDKEKLRRSLLLKIAAHIVMLIAFVAVLACWIIRPDFMRAQGALASKEDKESNSYFSSQIFFNKYGDQLDGLYRGLDAFASNHEEYPVNKYMEEFANFNYAVYDWQGKVIYTSSGWNKNALTSDDNYYYTIDLNNLNLFDTKIIRQADYIHYFPQNSVPEEESEEEIPETSDEKAQETFETAVVESEEPSVETEQMEGTLRYGSNFTNNTGFYYYDESVFAGNIGYICTYVPKELIKGDELYESYARYQNWKNWGAIGGIAAFIIGVTCLGYLIFSAGYSRKKESVSLCMIDKFYVEILGVMLFLVEAIFAIDIRHAGFMWDINYMSRVIFGSMVTFEMLVIVILSLVRRWKAGVLIKNTIIYRIYYNIYHVIYQGYIKYHLVREYMTIAIGFCIADIILMWSIFRFPNVIWIFFVLLLYVCEIVYAAMKILDIQKIKEGAQKISEGDLNFKINSEKMSGAFKVFAEDVNNIGNGLNAAVDESIKSERMKTDLITNVSHDIKTPLTSIINYVDLLKRENIQEQPLKEYIEVLDMKSQRLKVLIEDLVEASRASSGNLTLEKNKINFVELAAQVIGSFQEKFESKNLEMVVDYAEETMHIMADGRRLYRVLDNLFNNAFKYTLEGTRVYINMYVQDGKAYFVIKNISKTPLNISADELTQRFVRGDASRTTEGSGLGLSIAQSLTELHGGSFDIYLDGDLFKVTLGFECI